MLGRFPQKWYRDKAGLELLPWTVTEIRERLAEAAQTIRRLPMPKDGRPASFKAAWPDVAHDWLAYGWNPTRTPRIPPTPLEISRLDETLDWLYLLTRDQRLIVWARANHWSWRKLETLDELEHNGRGRTDRQLRNIMHDGEHRILNHLNGTPQRQRIEPHQLQATAKG